MLLLIILEIEKGMTPETVKATIWGLLVAVIVAALILAGSRNLSHFDAALVGYTFAALFAAFAICSKVG